MNDEQTPDEAKAREAVLREAGALVEYVSGAVESLADPALEAAIAAYGAASRRAGAAAMPCMRAWVAVYERTRKTDSIEFDLLAFCPEGCACPCPTCAARAAATREVR